jgi:cell division protein FtsB
MAQWLLVTAVVAAVLVCPAMMWLGRRGIGPGCAICPPRRNNEESLEELKARQRSLEAEIDRLEARPELVAKAHD